MENKDNQLNRPDKNISCLRIVAACVKDKTGEDQSVLAFKKPSFLTFIGTGGKLSRGKGELIPVYNRGEITYRRLHTIKIMEL